MPESQDIELMRQTLAGRLVQLRTAAELSQTVLAARIGCSRIQVVSVETCHRFGSAEFWTACDAALGSGDELKMAFLRIDVAAKACK